MNGVLMGFVLIGAILNLPGIINGNIFSFIAFVFCLGVFCDVLIQEKKK